MMTTLNPLTGLPVGTVPLQEVLGQAGVEFLKGISAGRSIHGGYAATLLERG